MKVIRIWTYDDCLGSAVFGFLDVFATANAVWQSQHPDASGPFRTRVESIGGDPVRSSSGLALPVQGRISATGAAAAVLLPGIFCSGGPKRLLSRASAMRGLRAPLRRQASAGAWLAANCSASFILAEAGLLDDRLATTTWWLADAFRERYPACRLDAQAILTEDRQVLCSGATTAYLDLALRIVERLTDAHLAAACARLLLIDASRDTQMPYMTRTLQQQVSPSDPLVVRSQRWMRRHVGYPFKLGALARAMASSERTLIRRFQVSLGTSPAQLAQSMRVETAKTLLETTDLDLERVVARVGYTDVSSFRRLFKRHVGLTPRAYRARFALSARSA